MNQILKENKNENGRSMVEMLGVLAVIGVLSVAGIAGYSNAMKQYRSNEILNATSTLYVMGMAQNAGNGADMNYTTIGTAPSGTSELAYNNTTKAITITFTDTDLCPLVKNKLGDKAGECNEGSLTVNLGETPTSETLTYNPNDPAKDCTTKSCCDENGGEWIDTGKPGAGRCVPEGWVGDCDSGSGDCVVCFPGETVCKAASAVACVPKGYTYVSIDKCIICSPSEGIAWKNGSGSETGCCPGELTCEGNHCTCQ